MPDAFSPASLSRTAHKIIETAAHLFMQRGYSAVSVNDIVRAAEITKPTLYYHFSDKAELFVQMGICLLHMMYERMQAALQGRSTCRERLLAIADVLIYERDGDMKMMRHEMSQHLSGEQQARIAAAFQEYLFGPLSDEMRRHRDAGFLDGTSAEELASLFLGQMEAFHRPAPDLDRPVPTYDAAPFMRPIPVERVVDMFLYGVATRRPGNGSQA
jgi:AcrR family transcriptional regulator